jgi:hypothetical protein
MALELQNAVTRFAVEILGAELDVTPPWLVRPGRNECRACWPLVQEIYAELTGEGRLPDTMPPRERRQVDAILVVGGESRILEVDETQHFNRFRALTLRRYACQVPLAFPAPAWIAAGEAKKRLEGGGFGKPRPPLFPEDGGRHQQRAFRDALADILPGEHGWLPTVRVADFEVAAWIDGPDAKLRMRALLASRL